MDIKVKFMIGFIIDFVNICELSLVIFMFYNIFQ